MKNAFSSVITSSLLAVSILVASSLPAKADSLVINLSDQTNSNTQNYPTVKITLDDTSNPGKITVKVDVVPGATGYIGDLRGVYFNLPGVSGLQIASVAGGPLTAVSTDGNFSSFNNSANLQGINQSFNLGAEIGQQGIAKGDDYQTTTFTISGNGLTLSAFTSQSVGVRMMSVGSPSGNRELSSKTLGTAPATVTITDPPVDNPPVNNPPVDNPPVDNPPVDNPPVDNPPVDNPPVDNPPVDNPPVINFPPIGDRDDDQVSVPEPATLAGLGLVAAALGLSRSKKK